MTTAPTPSDVERLAKELDYRASLSLSKTAASMLRRLQAENERLQQLLQCDTPRYCSSVQRCTAGDEHRAKLEARKPLTGLDAMRMGMEVARECRGHATGTTNWATAMTRAYERRLCGIKEEA